MTNKNVVGLRERVFRYFESRIDPFPLHDPQMPAQSLVGFFRYHLQGCEKQLALMVLLVASFAAIEVSLFGALGQLVDWMIASDPASFFQDYFWPLALLSFTLLVLMPAVIVLDALNTHQGVLGNIPMRIRWLGHRYLLKQSMGFYAEDFAGRIATKLMQTALSIRDCATKLCSVMIYGIVYLFSILILLTSADWRLGLPIFIWLIVYIGCMYYFLPRMKAVAARQAESRSMMTGRVVDAYANIMTVKLFSHTDREVAYAQQAMQPFLDTVNEQMRLATWMQIAIQCSVYITLFFVCALSIILWSQGAVGTGVIAVAMMVTMRLNGLAQWVMWEANMFFENLGTVTDGHKTMAIPLALTDPPTAPALAPVTGSIWFCDVIFNYGCGQNVIDQFNLQIRPGEKIGLIGRSGAGKSTLMHLLLRFYDVNSGDILIDGQSISQVTQASLRSHIGVVTQDTALLHRTVLDNITYGRPDATQAEIQSAIDKAQAREFIAQLTDVSGAQGLAALVGERGVKLSGGQRQRIAIARVLLKDAPILILDEATSALDSEVEQAIQESLASLMHNKTVIAIAHRLSTIATLDRLIVMDQGRIIEQGTHEQLLMQDGLYAQLWRRQSGGFILDESVDDATKTKG